MSIFKKKISELSSEMSTMKKELKLVDLIMLGIGAIVGTGIFVITGFATNEHTGPALTNSFLNEEKYSFS